MEEIRRAMYAGFGCELVECNGEAEHVHLIVHFPPTVALSRPVNSLKGRLLPATAAGVPQAGPALLAGKAAVVGVVLRRLVRRRTPGRAPAPTSSSNADRATRFRLRPEGRSPLAEYR